MAADRSAKKLKIHVGVFQAPWVNKAVWQSLSLTSKQ
jgi:predicted DNA-binding protein (MmcQ/YjbR family)